MRKAALAITLILALFFSAFTPNIIAQQSSDDWPMFQHDATHSGTGTGSPVLVPTLLWTSNVSTVVPARLVDDLLSIDTDWSSPVVVDGVVYLCSGTSISTNSGYNPASWSDVHAFNATSGANIWDCRISAWGNTVSSIAVADGLVFFGFEDFVGALNASSGVSLWNCTTITGFPSPTVVNGVVYFGAVVYFSTGGGIGVVNALNATNGKGIWSSTVGTQIIETAPAVVNGVVYVGSLDGNVYALNATNGDILWNYATTGDNNGILSAPAVSNGVVYAGSFNNVVYALNASNGKELWNFTTGDFVKTSPAVANGVVYVSSNDGNVYALNASNGAKLWNNPLAAVEPHGYLSSPAIVDDVVYVGSNDGYIYALNAKDGSKLWSYPIGRDFVKSPAIANGVLYVSARYYASNTTFVYALGSPMVSPSLEPTFTPEPPIESFPTTLAIAASIILVVVGIGLLVYFKKRGRGQPA